MNVPATLLVRYKGVNELFLCTIQWWHPNEFPNEHCIQTTGDKMLKFLEEVKLHTKLKNSEKKKPKNCQFCYKKTQRAVFMKLSKISILSSFICI